MMLATYYTVSNTRHVLYIALAVVIGQSLMRSAWRYFKNRKEVR